MAKEVLTKVNAAVQRARTKGFKGILLVLDELGKNLEFAAHNPECDDIFLLQSLAEEAARSGDHALVIVAMLHQGVAAYAAGLDTAVRREWDKVAGRFEEIVYGQPLEQVAALVAATLNVDLKALPHSASDKARTAMIKAVRAGLYGRLSASSVAELGPKIFPFHPTVLPVIVRAIRKFGQNERSLFSFISAFEPMGLQHHMQLHPCQIEFYRINHLFEYVRHNLLPSIATGNSNIHWGIIDSVLSSTTIASPEEESVFKSVALMTLLDSPDLPATEEFLQLALESGFNQTAISNAISELKRRGVLYERGTVRGLCLWPHTSVNLDDAFEKGAAATRLNGDGIELLCKQLPPEQIVPRSHYLRWGTLRYCEVQYLPATALDQLLANPPVLNGKGADLNLRILLPASQAQFRDAERDLRNHHRTLTKGLFIAVAQPPAGVTAALSNLTTWKWVQANTAALAGDRYAREEVGREVARAKRSFRDRLVGLDNLELPATLAMTWFSAEGETKLKAGRELLKFLGKECDRIYHRAPRVLNELINRRFPSSAAVAARTKLAEAMATAPDKAGLGMDDSKRPPEMALYLSILKEGGFHTETKSGWVFRLPAPDNDTCNLLPALQRVTLLLQEQGVDALVPVSKVFEALSGVPFGVREGLQPFILALYIAIHHQRVALYEDGTYLPEVGGDVFLRLMREPQFFHIQYCGLEGVRAEVFRKLLSLLKIDPRDAKELDLIDLLRPLTVFISREVPEYSRKTNNLPATAVAVRRALLDAREPIRLVFRTLPEACGLAPIGPDGLKTPDELATRLSIALHEIRTAYPNLIERLGSTICAAFDVEVGLVIGRRIIRDRAKQLSAVVTEPKLIAFAGRLADINLDDRAWIESVANLLARKSCERWSDVDEAEFHHQLEIAADRFKRTELALIGTTKTLNGHACRLSITKSDGTEVGDLINWEGMDESRIVPVEQEIHGLLLKHGRHGLAAAMRAIWTTLHADSQPEEP